MFVLIFLWALPPINNYFYLYHKPRTQARATDNQRITIRSPVRDIDKHQSWLKLLDAHASQMLEADQHE